MGCEISPSQLRRLLRDPIYVTGDYSVRRRGATHPGRRIPLGDPIPGDTFERNQELLSLRRGRENRTPIGTFCLNAVPVIHARCAQAVNARGLHAFLRGRVDPRHDARSYRHSPFVPPGCRGFSIDQGVLEGLVIRELRSLASNEALKVEFEKASGGSSTAGISVLTREDRRVLEVETRGLERRRTQLARGFRARVKAGEEHNELAYWELLGGLTAEIDQIRRRLSASDELEAVLATRQPLANPPEALRVAMDEVLTIEVPREDQDRVRRAALVQELVTKIVIHDEPTGSFRIEPSGPLRPTEIG